MGIKIYKTSKKPLIAIYAILAGVFMLVRSAAALIKTLMDRYLPYSIFTERYILIPAGIIVAFLSVIILPLFFYRAKYILSDTEITVITGSLSTRDQFMSMDAVRSVTLVMLPLSILTGFNFIVLNTMGARVILPFLSRHDAKEIFGFVNGSIRSRGETG